jgi:membrane-associated phospholipid phosphatase
VSFLTRYDDDTSRPTRRQWRHDLARRALLPAAALWLVIVGLGFLITGPLGDLPAEDEVNQALAEDRTPVLDSMTSLWSNIGATEFIILACALAIALVWWRTREWWLAVVPGIAVSVQAGVFVTAAAVVGRDRPEVEKLDEAPPTSSFPSGHVGASTAFYLTLALLAQRIRQPVLRWAATAVCLLVPVLVAFARLYRGMHQLSDVLVGVLNGVVCAWLAWHYLRREQDGEPGVRPATVPGAQTLP